MRHPIAAAALLASLAFVPRPASADDMNVSVRTGHEVRTCDDLEVRSTTGRRSRPWTA